MARPAVNLTINARDRTRAAFASAGRQLEGLAGQAGRVSSLFRGGLGIAAVGAAAGLAVRQLSQVISELDDLDKAAQRAGTSVENLQAVRFVGELGGVDVRASDLALQRWNRRLGQARNGLGELLPVLRQYGISLNNADGSARASAEVLSDFQATLSGLPDDAELAAAGMAAFDSEGVGLAFALRDVNESLDVTRDRMRQLGLLVSSDVTDAAAGATDAMTTLGTIMRTATQTAVAPLAEEIRKAADNLLVFLGLADDSSLFRESVDEITDFTDHLERFASADAPGFRDAVRRNFEDVTQNVTDAFSIIREQIASGLPAEEVNRRFQSIIDAQGRLVQSLGRAGNTEQYQTALALLTELVDAQKEFNTVAEEGEETVETLPQNLQKALDAARNRLAVQEAIVAGNTREAETLKVLASLNLEDSEVNRQRVQSLVDLNIQYAQSVQHQKDLTASAKAHTDFLAKADAEAERMLEKLRQQTERREMLAEEGRTEIAILEALNAGEDKRARAIEFEAEVAATRARYAEVLSEAELDQFEAALRRNEELAKQNDLLAEQQEVMAGIQGVLNGFEDSTEGWLQTLGNVLTLFAQITELGGGNLGQGFRQAFNFGGGRQSGGSVRQGTSYLIGERGPELFTPGVAGMVSPIAGAQNIDNSRTVIVNTSELGEALSQQFYDQAPYLLNVLAEAG